MTIILIFIFVFLILRMLVACYNYFSTPKLPLYRIGSPYRISILIPVRNEEMTIISLLQSIADQNYSNFEVIILNDNSTDNTLALVEDFAKGNVRFRVINGKPLEQGWTGKNFACWQLAQEASGQYLLFLDADVKVSDDLLSSAIYHLRKNRLCLLSVFSDQQMKTVGEKQVVPLMNYLLLSLLPVKLIFGHSNPIFAAACGQFMLFDNDTYRQYQWHYSVRQEVTEDLKIMKLVKLAGCKGDSLLANGLITCRMYNSYTEAVDGFSKNFIAPFNDSIPLFILFLTCVMVGPVLILATLDIYLILCLCCIVLLTRLMISNLSGQNAWHNAFLHPLQMLSLMHIGCLAVQRKTTKTRQWKGRVLN